MAERPSPSPEGDEQRIADARNLLGDASQKASHPGEVPSSSAGPGPADSYDLEDFEEIPDRPPTPPISPAPRPDASSPAKKKTTPESERPARPAMDPSDAVEQVWSRWGEWGPTFILLGVVAVVLFGIIFLAVANYQFGIAIFFLLTGGVALVLLSYPIVITLERPVRMTPEQAVRDFYTALGHHYPHYRRMWLLLSGAGRTSGSFASFEGFKDYWKGQLDRLRGGKAGKTTPLKFQILDFRSEKAAGQPAIDVKYTLEISIRGQTEAGPVEKLRVETSLVRGPDRMWYLDQGTLPASKG